MFPWSFHALLFSFRTLLNHAVLTCSQVNAYLDDLQLSKTVFILTKFCCNKFFISADKGFLILYLVPH